MSITHLSSLSQLDSILSKSNDKLSIIDFHATWCGPCHMIAPVFEALSKQHTNVNFLKCDVDVARDVASRYSISAMPTFVFLRGSTQVDQIRGANRRALEQAIAKHASSSSGAFSGSGHTLGGSSTPQRDAAPNGGPSLLNLDQQTKTLLLLVAGYLVFWYLS
ncbi:thioredoxin-domain-containing protein [Dentipellis sp. KUC8613]|nr:thioredoxin-domain-containing protein [Dentipellis sp. KUC8613]